MISYLTQTIHESKAPILCLLKNAAECERYHQDLTFLLMGTGKTVAFLPDYEVALDDDFSPAAAVISQRLSILHQLLNQQIDVLITTEQQALTLLPPKSFVAQNVFSFKVGDKINMTRFKSNLVQLDYSLVNHISSPKQFAVRGAIIDIYPPQTKHPIRIELDDDEIAGIHQFHIETQRSFPEEIQHIEVTPSIEYLPEAVNTKNIALQNPSHPLLNAQTLKSLSNNNIPRGWHRLLPTLHSSQDTLLSYIGEQCRVISGRAPTLIQEEAFAFLQSTHSDFAVSQQQGSKLLQKCNHAEVTTSEPTAISLSSKSLKSDLNLITKKQRLVIVCQSYFRLHQLEAILLSQDIDYTRVGSWYESSSKNIPIAICQGEIAQSITLANDIIIPEHSLTDKVIIKEARPQQSLPANQLKLGDLLIHVDHGVGRFSGIETRKIGGIVQDFVIIQYAQDDKLLFPPNQLYKIHPYIGGQLDVDALKSKKWQRRKAKAIKNIEDFSAKLLRLQANRKENAIEPINLPNEYAEFVEQFPFSETRDQLSIMEAIINDLSQSILFDRLVCGDVGFGKTEIAMRSAFIALMNGYQVAIIAPTTVLATQHYNNFKARMAQWNITIGLLSRSNTQADKDREKVANGDIQLAIGTHKLLSQPFSNLALVIIDEEHKFGVKQKDSIQAFSQSHKLSLTATPIPRSLNMALSKLKQLSIMTSPPKQRLPIQTFVEEESDEVVKKALEREVHRGGQAYIVYNDVKTMDHIHRRLERLCPHISFGTVHGQMPVSAAERQMARFHSQSFQVLIASTIIESGLDVPNANTIVIYRADKLGLAQLHQIRGRVGRAHHQAYAYLLTPDAKISKNANMRLNAISQSIHLGSGYELSIQDLEIRGCGNLLGEEQSGHVNAIGLSYYTHLLDQATTEETIIKTEVDLEVSAIIPETYIAETEVRYQFYHTIASATTEADLEDAQTALIDRFGKLPIETENLVAINTIKLKANKLGIHSIVSRPGGILIDVGEQPLIEPKKLLELVSSSDHYGFGGKHHIKILNPHPPAAEVQAVERFLQVVL